MADIYTPQVRVSPEQEKNNSAKNHLGFYDRKAELLGLHFLVLDSIERKLAYSQTTFICPEMFTNELCRCRSAHDPFCLQRKTFTLNLGPFP
jgi:hypothetical protein